MTDETNGATESAASTAGVSAEIMDVLHFDPFRGDNEVAAADAKASTVANTDKAAAGGDEKGKEAVPSAPAKVEAAPAAAAPVKKTEESVNTSEMNQEQAWRAIAEAALATKPAGKEENKAEEPDPRKVPAYNFQMPDALIEKLSSQNPEDFKVGLNAYANGIAAAVHAQAFKHVEEYFKPLFESMPQNVFAQIEARKAADEVKKDFYGRYAEFDKPVLHPVIKQIGEQLAKEGKVTKYTPEFGDAIAAKARELLGIVAAPAVVKPNAPKAPPKMLPSQGARVAPSSEDSLSREVADVIFG